MSSSAKKTAIIIGAGPAGLTAAYELLHKTAIKPIILEMSNDIGGISKTVNYKGNRIDIGGHRFFSKSDKVMNWWQEILPIESKHEESTIKISYQGKEKEFNPIQKKPDSALKVLLVRNRKSRIFFLQKFFDYPISLSLKTFSNLGLLKSIKIGFSYVFSRISPIKNETTLEDFLINRFGKVLYKTFFKDYTEKVWGKSCKEIPSSWGKQRIKGVSVSKVLTQAFLKNKGLKQKNIETSLINKFLYPRLGPGQLWEEVAKIVIEKGGEIHLNSKASELFLEKHDIKKITSVNLETGKKNQYSGDYFFSTMPVKELINTISPKPQDKLIQIANDLEYRDFITVGLLLKKLKLKNSKDNLPITDNWIYIQEKSVKLGRLQIFNNWSPDLVKNKNNSWLGLEYFCNEGDELWEMNNKEFIQFAIEELASINIIDKNDVLDATVIRMPKTYPAYFGSYNQFGSIQNYTDTIENLFLIGRNGMHKYNNQDHSMLTAMQAVENIMKNVKSKDNIWAINTDDDYQEEK